MKKPKERTKRKAIVKTDLQNEQANWIKREEGDEEPEHQIILRNLTVGDYDDIREIHDANYPEGHEVWEYRQIKKLLSIFPEGQICIEDKGRVVACALAIIVSSELFDTRHTYLEIIGNYTFSTHNPKGDLLYGIEVMVHPDFKDMRLGRRLYDARKEMCENLNLKGIVAGGRMPNYHKHSNELTPKEYIKKVASKEIYDPVLTFQLSNDFHVKKILRGYLPEDKESKSYATLIEWNNLYYEKSPETIIGGKTPYVRVGVVQWQMRPINTLEGLFETIEFFVDAISGYKADFVLFPELFNVPLMMKFRDDETAVAIRKLAGFTDEIREKFMEFAVSYNVNIISGSLPYYEDETLYNVSYLCRRDGSYEEQYKIHITPSEAQDWGMKGGNKLRVFDTDRGKVGILICYDVEFPELGRYLAGQNMQILFVPFATDTRNAYERVRICSQARAIENECYVVIAGSVGNLPKVRSMDIQYAQSGVFSPSDFAFPHNAIVAEATPNSESTLIADLDLDLLKDLHIRGSVKNLQDRRDDLYDVKWYEKKSS